MKRFVSENNYKTPKIITKRRVQKYKKRRLCEKSEENTSTLLFLMVGLTRPADLIIPQ